MEDLVGPGIADAAEQVRIGEGPLERVALADERRPERLQVRVQDLQATRVVVRQRRLTGDAERAGNGNGRTYTITITCTDTAGASSSEQVKVQVPKSRGK